MNEQTKHSGARTAGMLLVILVLLIGGLDLTTTAARAAIPGDALYPLKTGLEQTRLTLARDAGDRAQMRLGFAEQRLEEIAALINQGRYPEVGRAVLFFEADINTAILELETISALDPVRASSIASEITSALTRYAQTLSVLAASAPESVRSEVVRALDTTRIAGSLELPSAGLAGQVDGNVNSSMNGNSDDSNTNDSLEDSNANDNINSSLDDGNANGNDDSSNTNGASDDNSNTGSNTNGDDHGGSGGGGSDDSNSNGDDHGGGGGGHD